MLNIGSMVSESSSRKRKHGDAFDTPVDEPQIGTRIAASPEIPLVQPAEPPSFVDTIAVENGMEFPRMATPPLTQPIPGPLAESTTEGLNQFTDLPDQTSQLPDDDDDVVFVVETHAVVPATDEKSVLEIMAEINQDPAA